MQVNRMNNMLEGNDEERERKWFQTKKEKSLEKGKQKFWNSLKITWCALFSIIVF